MRGPFWALFEGETGYKIAVEAAVLDYIEGVGQEIGYYISELRKRKYDQALLVLPHDGNAYHGPIHKTYKDHFQDAGFEVM
ncbi:MAG: hypothetical protein WAK55_03795 [Xanthobacteraceae bacterium]